MQVRSMLLARPPRDKSVTFRVDADVLMRARTRAFLGGSSLNAIVAQFLEEYAAVPARWIEGMPPPWTAKDRIRPVIDPVGAGHRAAGQEGEEADVALDSAIAEALLDKPGVANGDTQPPQP
jgi:hypothetical protein